MIEVSLVEERSRKLLSNAPPGERMGGMSWVVYGILAFQYQRRPYGIAKSGETLERERYHEQAQCFKSNNGIRVQYSRYILSHRIIPLRLHPSITE
jgi:hypothetical protein